MTRVHYVLAANALLALFYYLAGRFGLSLAFYHESASAVWPPTGLAISVIILYGPKLLPGVFTGAFLVNAATTSSIPVVIGIAFGNTFEALLGAWLASRVARGRYAFDQADTTVKFVCAASLPATMLSASIGVTALFFGGFAAWERFGAIWLTWWLGDFVSAIIVCPLLLIWFPHPGNSAEKLRISREVVAVLATLILSTVLLFGPWAKAGAERYPLDFLLLPPLLWASYRFEQRGAALASFIVSAIAIYGTLNGRGPFALADRNTALVLLQAFMGTITLTSLVLAALVSERRRTDEKRALYQEIFRNSIDGIAIINPDGTYFEQNASHANMLGYDEDQLQGATPEIHLGREQFEMIVDALKNTGHYRGEVLSKARDGRTIPIEIAAFTVRQGERILCHVGIKRDITERKQAEADLRRAELELRRHANELESRVAERTADLSNSVKSLESFCYSIAHDLRAPLRGIHGFCAALRDEYEPELGEAGRLYLKKIAAAVERMDQLIHDLLEYGRISKADNGGVSTDLNLAIKEVCAELQNEIQKTGATIEIAETLPSLPLNKTLLTQVLRNLLTNALKFVPPGVAPRIQVSAEKSRSDVRIAFKDNGIGIHPDHHDRIFNLFERLHSEAEFPGTGVGLAIVKKSIERAGGKVWVESNPGEGSCFWIEFPKLAGKG